MRTHLPARPSVQVPLLALLLSLSVPIGASAGLEVHVLYDETADFSTYETYRWAAQPIDETPETEMVDERVRNAADTELDKKGLQSVGEGEEADLLLTYHVRTEDNLLIEGVRYEIAPHVVWTGADPLDVTHHWEVGTLVLDFADADTEQIVWSGAVQGRAATVAQLRDKIEKAVRKLLKRYPPD